VRSLILLCLLVFSLPPLQASTLAEYTFDDPKKHDEFRDVIEQMRCLVCQNESLAGSNADLAVDLRNEIYEMMKQGQGQDEVVKFMVARYGDFVLYDPPLKPTTYPIWFGPLIIFIVGALVLVRILKRKSQSREADLSDEERQRLANLLNQSTDPRDTNQ
jgi:cytochrome c-type biogenesis protein CcmH